MLKVQWRNSSETEVLQPGHRVYPGVVAEAASAAEIRAMAPGARILRVGEGPYRMADPGDHVMAWNDEVAAFVAATVLDDATTMFVEIAGVS